MDYKLIIPNDFQNFVKEKYKFVLAYQNNMSTTHNENRQNLFKIKSRLSGMKEKDVLLYLSINLFRLASSRYADFEVGSAGVNVDFSDNKINQTITSLIDSKSINSVIYDCVTKKSMVGYSIVRIINNKANSDIKIQKIPTSNYFSDTNGLSIGSSRDDIKKHYIVNVEKIMEGDDTKWYTHVDRYEMQTDGSWLGIYEKYNYSEGFRFKSEDFIEEKGRENMKYLPLFVFNNDVLQDEEVGFQSETKDEKSTGFAKLFFSQSDYVDIFDIIQEINDRFSQISVELIKNLQSKMSVPSSYIDNLNKSKLAEQLQSGNKDSVKTVGQRLGEKNNNTSPFDYIVHGQGEQPAHYITKENNMIDQALSTVDRYIRLVSALTSIPISLLGLEESSGNKKVGTDNNEFDAFYTKIEQRRIRIYPTLQKLFAYIYYIHSGGVTYKLPTIKFQKLKSKNTKEKVDICTIMKMDGVLSTKSYLQIALDMDDQEVEEEMVKINNDLKTQSHIDGTFLPSQQ